MRAKVYIYVEGNDSLFLEQYINALNINRIVAYKVIPTKGKDRIYNNDLLIELDKTSSTGGINLIVFDANGEKIQVRKEQILQRIKEETVRKGYTIKIDGIFLLPNDSEGGALESLLLNIMNPKHTKPIFDCFDSYIECIKKKGYFPTREKEINKVRVYCYLESLDKDGKEIAKDRNGDYTNPDHWDLQHDYLTPIKEFLQHFFTN